MTTINHYGKTIDSDEPVTSVLSARDVWWLTEHIQDEGVDLDYEEYIDNGGDPDEYEMMEPTLLLGFVKGQDGIYEEDPEAEICVIYRGDQNTLQITRSIFKTKGTPASPCYPGQCTIEPDGEFWCYAPSISDYDAASNTIPKIYVDDITREIRMQQELRNHAVSCRLDDLERQEICLLHTAGSDPQRDVYTDRYDQYIDDLILSSWKREPIEQRLCI